MTPLSGTLRLVVVAAPALTAVSLVLAGAIRIQASHGTFTTSAGIYRIPYADGTAVTANNDHHNHPNVPNRVDLGGGDGATIVAAASGVIRGLVDRNGNSGGQGDGLAADGVTPQDDALEHSCLDDANVAGDCSDYNNYVWIEHPNGEWTKYTHFATGSVSGLGWAVGDTIFVGQALGTQSDVGSASGSHLHFEVAAVPAGAPNPPFSALGGFVNSGWNVVTVVCFSDGDDNGDTLYTDGEQYTAGPCANTAPTADAGGPYEVDEGATILLDGTGSADPHNAILSYSWSPDGNLDDGASATPVYTAVDDTVDQITLTVSDLGGDVTPATALTDDDVATVTVLNVPPTVSAQGDSIVEGGVATVRASFTDPGTLDTHTASIHWGDGAPVQPVSVASLAAGVQHAYGDDGAYSVTVTVTDDDGGSGVDVVAVLVGNLAPAVTMDTSGAISFPGGDYLLVNAGGELPSSAEGTDAGSDDLKFTWSVGGEHAYFNDGVGPDPLLSPFGTFPFQAADAIDAVYAEPGVEQLTVTLEDDDGGSDSAGGTVLVLGNASQTEGAGWWKHQFSGDGQPHIDTGTAAAYLEIVNAVSGVFSEQASLASAAEASLVLSPHAGDRRARARAELLVAWLQFASGAVAWNAEVRTGGQATIGFLDLMFQSEAVIANPAATDAALLEVERQLRATRHASS